MKGRKERGDRRNGEDRECVYVRAHACTHGIEMSVHNVSGQLRVNWCVTDSQLQPRQGTASLC